MFESWLPITNLAGFLALIGSIVFFQWRSGAGVVAKETIALLQSKVKALEDANEDAKVQLHNQSVRISQFETMVNERDKKIGDLMLILQGRDEATIKFQAESMKAISMTHTIVINTERTLKATERLTTAIEKHLHIIATNKINGKQ